MITQILLAAGLSVRMKSSKPLLDFGGKPLLVRLLKECRQSLVDKIVVVLGHEKKRILQYFGHALGCDRVPAAIFAIQTYGDQLNWHPHLHSLLADGAWGKETMPSNPSPGSTRTFSAPFSANRSWP